MIQRTRIPGAFRAPESPCKRKKGIAQVSGQESGATRLWAWTGHRGHLNRDTDGDWHSKIQRSGGAEC